MLIDDKLTNKDAITVLRNLQDWLYLSGINGGTSIQREAIDIAIKALEAEPHWIPVTERPDKSGDYLATLIDGAEKWVEIIYWNETFGGSWQAVIGDEEYYSTIGNVIAWMPLPPVYQGE